LGWAVGAGTRRLGARTWPGAGGRTDSQPRPEQQGNRDPVTLPRPRPADGSAVAPVGRCRSGVTSRAARPTVALADWSRPSSAPMSDLPDAVWYARLPPTRTPLLLASTTTRCSASPWSPSPGSSTRPSPPLRSARFPPFGCAWSRSTARVLACYVENRAVLRGLVHRMAMGPSRRRDRPAAPGPGAVVVAQAGRSSSGGGGAGGTTERVAALAMDDGRGRVAEARAQAAEQALQAGPNRAGPTYRGPGPSPR
jgi:hypothetical protein